MLVHAYTQAKREFSQLIGLYMNSGVRLPYSHSGSTTNYCVTLDKLLKHSVSQSPFM